MNKRPILALFLAALPLAFAHVHANAKDAQSAYAAGEADEDDTDDDDADGDDDYSDASAPCMTNADGQPGAHNSAGPNTGNGGAGGTIILEGKPAPGDCVSANGGKGGSFNWGTNLGNTGNGGKGGKITF